MAELLVPAGESGTLLFQLPNGNQVKVTASISMASVGQTIPMAAKPGPPKEKCEISLPVDDDATISARVIVQPPLPVEPL